MKKWIFIVLVIVVGIFIYNGCDGNKIDECLKKRKGCEITGDNSENFLEEDMFNGNGLIAKLKEKKYPYYLRNKEELKTAKLYFDVSAGLKDGTAKFSSFINAIGDYMAGSQLEIYKSSFKDATGKIHNEPVKQTKELNSIITELKDETTYSAGASFLEGTIKDIVGSPDKMSIFVTDLLRDEINGNGSNIDGQRIDCFLCEDFSWCEDDFAKWFGLGGQIAVVTQKAKVNNNPNGNMYALIFIPKGHEVKQLLQSLDKAGINEDDISFFNPLGLSFDFSELVKLQDEDEESLTIIEKGPGYIVIGSENDVLPESSEALKLNMKLIDQTGMRSKWSLKVTDPVDFYDDIFNQMNKEAQTSTLFHKNENIQSQNAIKISVNGTTINLNLSKLENKGKADVLMRKFEVYIDCELDLDQSKFSSLVKAAYLNRPLPKQYPNNCLYLALQKSLIKGGDSVSDLIYKKIPILTIYSVVNVKK